MTAFGEALMWARYETTPGRDRDMARRLTDEIQSLESQLQSLRRELVATVANIGEWADVLADVIPALRERMGND